MYSSNERLCSSKRNSRSDSVDDRSSIFMAVAASRARQLATVRTLKCQLVALDDKRQNDGSQHRAQQDPGAGRVTEAADRKQQAVEKSRTGPSLDARDVPQLSVCVGARQNLHEVACVGGVLCLVTVDAERDRPLV